MAQCPNCRHNPKGALSAYMYVKRCRSCGKKFCHQCEHPGMKCPRCGSADVDEHHEKIYGD